MASNVDRRKSWIWKYCIKDNDIIKCDICPGPSYVCNDTSNYTGMKRHLFHVHKISHDKDTDDRTSLIWPYFIKKEKYTFLCRICDKSISGRKRNDLERHLIRLHPQKIAEVQEEFKRLWVSHHFILHTGIFLRLFCQICYKMFNIFTEINDLATHLLVKHDVNESYHTEGNMNMQTIQFTYGENNANATSHQTDSHSQAERNQYNDLNMADVEYIRDIDFDSLYI